MIQRIAIFILALFFLIYSQSDLSRYGNDPIFPFYGWRMFTRFKTSDQWVALRVKYTNEKEDSESCFIPFCEQIPISQNIRLFYLMFRLSDKLLINREETLANLPLISRSLKRYFPVKAKYEFIYGEIDPVYFLTRKKMKSENLLQEGAIE